MNSRQRKAQAPAGKVYVEWDLEAELVQELDDLAAREGRTRDAVIEGALAEFLAGRRRDSAKQPEIE
jgi:predicted transcriptional regulator